MSFIKGKLGGRTFQVSRLPSGFDARLAGEALGKNAFRQEWKGAGTHTGWTLADNLLSSDFSADRSWLVQEDLLIFAFRLDTRKVPGVLLKAHIARECAAWKAEHPDAARVPATVRREIRESVTSALIPTINAKSKTFDVVWDPKAGTLIFGGTNALVVDAFRTLFCRTFGCELENAHPMGEPCEAVQVQRFYLWLWWASEEASIHLNVHSIQTDDRISLSSSDSTTTVVADNLSRAPEPRQVAARGRFPKGLKLLVDLGEGPFQMCMEGDTMDLLRIKMPEAPEEEEEVKAEPLERDAEILIRVDHFRRVDEKRLEWVRTFQAQVDNWDAWYESTCLPWLRSA